MVSSHKSLATLLALDFEALMDRFFVFFDILAELKVFLPLSQMNCIDMSGVCNLRCKRFCTLFTVI